METVAERAGASRAAIRHHYDLSNAFYGLWLDRSMTYSCALWHEGDDLERAQVRKIDWHIHEARAASQERVLDIGCGWGGLLRRLVVNHDVRHAFGLTLSEAQAQWIRDNAVVGLEVRVEDWKEFQPAAPFDAIISIGAFEHFAQLDFSEEEKVAAYRRFFETCCAWLKSGSCMTLQTFAYGSALPMDIARAKESTQFLARHIFPETDPPKFANIAKAIEGYFHIEMVRNDCLHYAMTCRAWLERLSARRAEATMLVGEETVRKYERYLMLSYLGFQNRNLALYRITLKRVDSKIRS